MRNLKQILSHLMGNSQRQIDLNLIYQDRRSTLILAISEYTKERVTIMRTSLPDYDKETMDNFYQRELDKYNSELFWLDVKFELNIV